MKHYRLLILMLLAALMAMATGCSKIDGSVSGNQAPSVSFVNNQQDADSARQSFDIPNYTFIFPDSLQGFTEAVGGSLPSELDVEAKFELIRYQFFFVTNIESITEVDPITGTSVTVPEANYRLDENIARYLWIQHTAAFQWKLGRNYVINGSFEYLPVYSFAPMIFWSGTDPDGFVERYRYLDYEYESEAGLTALLARVYENDAALEDTTQTIHWIETVNTSAVINLTTQLGRIQKHVVILQAIDNTGDVSDPVLRTFNRSNRAPNTPTMAYYKDGYTRVSQPGEYDRHIIGWEDIETDPTFITQLKEQVSTYYEIPMAAEQLENWKGVRFLISGDDPDDQALVTIPLQFRFVLNRIPDADAAVAMADNQIEDSDGRLYMTDASRVALTEDNTADLELHNFDVDGWSQHNQIELFNLPTGFYQLAVFSRDDGLEECAEPAWMRFKVQQLAFDKDVLVVDYTPTGGAPGTIGLADDAAYEAWYKGLVEEVMPSVKAAAEGESGYAVTWEDQAGESANCRYWKMGADGLQLPFSVISQYHTVICLDDKWAQGSGQGNSNGAWIRNPAKGFWMDYLDMGGSLLWSGYSSMIGTFNYQTTSPNNSTTDASAVSDKAGDFLAQYMGILGVYGDINTTFFNGRIDGLVGALPEFQGQAYLNPDTLMINSLQTNTQYRSFYTYNAANPYRPVAPDSALVFIEANAINENLGTVAAYTYDSYSAGLPEQQVFEVFRVAQQSDLPLIFYTTDETNYPGEAPRYAAYSTNPDETGCWLHIPQTARNFWDMQITDAIAAWNVSRADSMWSEPFLVTKGKINGVDRVFIRVNYQRLSEPWTAGQQVNVEAIWRPILPKHRKPLILYTENTAYQGNFGGFNFSPYYTNFRTSWNNFPMHLMERGTLPASQDDAGSGALGVLNGVLYQFYLPKLQDLQ